MKPTTHVTSLPPDHAVRAGCDEPESDAVSHPVGERGAPPLRELQPVLSIRGCVKESAVPSFIRNALHQILRQIEKRHLEVQGPPFTISRPAGPHEVDVEAGWPVDRASPTGRISAGVLPIGLVRRGPDDREQDRSSPHTGSGDRLEPTNGHAATGRTPRPRTLR